MIEVFQVTVLWQKKNSKTMEDGGVDLVIESCQHKMDRIADFLPLLVSLVFYY